MIQVYYCPTCAPGNPRFGPTDGSQATYIEQRCANCVDDGVECWGCNLVECGCWKTCRLCGKTYKYWEEGDSYDPDLCDDCWAKYEYSASAIACEVSDAECRGEVHKVAGRDLYACEEHGRPRDECKA